MAMGADIARRGWQPDQAGACAEWQVWRERRIGIERYARIVVPDLDAGFPVDKLSVSYHGKPGGTVHVMTGYTGYSACVSSKIPIRAPTPPVVEVHVIPVSVYAVPEIRCRAGGIVKCRSICMTAGAQGVIGRLAPAGLWYHHRLLTVYHPEAVALTVLVGPVRPRRIVAVIKSPGEPVDMGSG